MISSSSAVLPLTFFSSHEEPIGAFKEAQWTELLRAIRQPSTATEKSSLSGYSLARFDGNQRAAANVIAVGALTFDHDAGEVDVETAIAALDGEFAGVVFSTHSHAPEKPRFRVIMLLSRSVSASEYTRIWARVASIVRAKGIQIDEATKDAGRFWYEPACRPESSFLYGELGGEPIDVDLLLVTPPVAAPPAAQASPHVVAGATVAVTGAATVAARRAHAAELLGRNWAPQGQRHGAQLALAGMLRGAGVPEAEALEILCSVCKIAGDEDREKRKLTIRDTYAHSVDSALAVTAWKTLGRFVDPAIVAAARALLPFDASARAEFEALVGDAPPGRDAAPGADAKPARSYLIEDASSLIQPLAPVKYTFKHFGVAPGRPTLLAGYGGIGKTIIVQSLLLHMSAGKDSCWGLPLAKGRGLHIDYEMTRDPVARRYQRLAVGHGIELAACDLKLSSMPKIYLSDSDAEEALCAAAEGATLAIIDNLAAACATGSVGENESGMRRFLDTLTRVSDRTGATFLVLAHERKQSKDEGSSGLQKVRGSSAITDACGSVISLAIGGEGDGVLSLTQSKSSHRKPGDEILLRVVDVGDALGDDDAPGLLIERICERPIGEVRAKMQSRIIALLSKGPQTSKREIDRALGAKNGACSVDVEALLVRREIVKLPGVGFVRDTPEARTERIVRAVQAAPLGNPASVARAAYVDVDVVLDVARSGIIARSAEGRYLVRQS